MRPKTNVAKVKILNLFLIRMFTKLRGNQEMIDKQTLKTKWDQIRQSWKD